MDDHSTKPRRTRTGALRDLLLISLAAVALLWVVTVTGFTEAVQRVLRRAFPGHLDEILVGLALAVLGLALLALLRWRQGRRELAARGTAEERYRALVEQLPAVVYIDAIDDVSTALYISPQYERVFGYPPEARTNDPEFWIRHLHPEDREWVLAESKRTNETREPFVAEYRFLAADGRILWVRDEAAIVYDAEGKPLYWHGVLLDVTERKLAEQTLSRRDAILDAVGFAAERFLKAGDWQRTLPQVLERLGTASGVSRVYVFRNEPAEGGGLGMTLVREWLADGVPPLEPESNDRFPYAEGFQRWEDLLGSGRALHGSTREFPPEEQEHLSEEGVVSQVVVPVFADGEWWGYLGFDECALEREWPQAEREALKAAGDILGGAIGRERAELRQAETENRYRTLVETIPAITYIQGVGPQEGVYYISPQVEGMLGFTVEEWGPSYDSWYASLHPDDRDRVLQADARSDETGEPFVVEYRQRHRDGHWVWVHDEAVLVRDGQGQPLYWQGVRFDITAQKEAEKHLREAERRFRTLVETIPAVTYIDRVDEESSTVYVSPQIETMFGYTVEAWKADPALWTEGLHPDDRQRILEAARRHNELGEPFEVDYRFRGADGRWIWVRDQATIVGDEAGLPRFSQGVMYDATESRQAEELLRETEAKYRALVEHIPAVLYVDPVDEHGRTIYVSPQVERVLGVTQEAYLADPELWLELIHPGDRERVLAVYRESLEHAEGWAVEYRIVRPDSGETVWIRDESAFLFDDHGKPSLVQGALFDVTERRLAEEALKTSERREREAAERLRSLDEMKNTFLAAVSHELRSPLTSILGTALTLESQDVSEADRADLLGRLAQNARKLDRLLSDLLDIDRLNRGILVPQHRPTDLDELVRRTVESFDLASAREVDLDLEPVVVPVDPAKVERIVENLVANALRHTGPETGVWVRVRREVGGAMLAVDDDGPGVPDELRRAIFEPFRQGPTASPHSPGTGIGLSLVAMFAELHGGRAWVEDRPGGGSSFRVFLPATPVDEHGNGTKGELASRGAEHLDSASPG